MPSWPHALNIIRKIKISCRMMLFAWIINTAIIIISTTITMPIISYFIQAIIFVAHVCSKRKDKHIKIFSYVPS